MEYEGAYNSMRSRVGHSGYLRIGDWIAVQKGKERQTIKLRLNRCYFDANSMSIWCQIDDIDGVDIAYRPSTKGRSIGGWGGM